MSYLVLARKFRPQTFSSVVGQDHITKALANAIVRGRMPHALLFTGPRGVGKTTTARLVARAMNCTGRQLPKSGSEEKLEESLEDTRQSVEPCGNCVNCKEIARGSSMAVWEIDGASNNSVENIRELIDSLRSLPPPNTPYKIYIIDEVHMLSVAAFNALLKSLEEPPPNTIFVFATTEPHKIPETVISRCQRHDFLRIPLEVIVEQLGLIAREEKLIVDEDVFFFIARRAQGGMRDAQTMLDRLIAFSDEGLKLEHAQRVFGVVDENFCFRLSEAVIAQNAERCFELVAEAFQQSIDIRAFVQDFLWHWRNLLLVGVTRISSAENKAESQAALRKTLEVSSSQLEQLQKQVASSSSFDLQRLFDIAEDTAQRALSSAFPRFVLEAGVAKMATLSSLKPLAEILTTLKEIGSIPISDDRPVTARPAIAHRIAPSHSAPSSARPTNTSAQKIESGQSPESPISELAKADFNPSWQEFVAHVRSRRELVLEAFLRRATPQKFETGGEFGTGELVLETVAFDGESLQERSTQQSLKACLKSYSGIENWEVRVQIHQTSANKTSPGTPRTVSAPVPGSLAELENREELEKKKRLERDARNDPSVKETLKTFEGSSIERVSILPISRG